VIKNNQEAMSIQLDFDSVQAQSETLVTQATQFCELPGVSGKTVVFAILGMALIIAKMYSTSRYNELLQKSKEQHGVLAQLMQKLTQLEEEKANSDAKTDKKLAVLEGRIVGEYIYSVIGGGAILLGVLAWAHRLGSQQSPYQRVRVITSLVLGVKSMLGPSFIKALITRQK
jgi:hypothetical protein